MEGTGLNSLPHWAYAHHQPPLTSGQKGSRRERIGGGRGVCVGVGARGCVMEFFPWI